MYMGILGITFIYFILLFIKFETVSEGDLALEAPEKSRGMDLNGAGPAL